LEPIALTLSSQPVVQDPPSWQPMGSREDRDGVAEVEMVTAGGRPSLALAAAT
jgi:hypothetical protein